MLLLITDVIVVVPTAGCVIEHLHRKLDVALKEEVQQAADLSRL
jgi:hypothetical protein